MHRDDVLNKVIEVIKDVMDDEKLELGADSRFSELEEWDSVVHMTIMATIESEFGIRFEIDEIVQYKSVGEVVESVLHKTA